MIYGKTSNSKCARSTRTRRPTSTSSITGRNGDESNLDTTHSTPQLPTFPPPYVFHVSTTRRTKSSPQTYLPLLCRTPFQSTTRTKVPVPLVASSAGALGTHISSTTTPHTGRQSGQFKKDQTFSIREPEHGSARIGTYSPPARRNALPPTIYAHYAAVPTQLSNGILPVEFLAPQISSIAAKEPLYSIFAWHDFSHSKILRKPF
ncbi:hypothetical protein GGU11DRAFT_751895 [Lentinula aff. detonsa]|nr:hypothetical protein GGU11DRAFT_751895 [Lentinula aff. detonsa]